MPLEEDVEHGPVLIDSPPEPIGYPTHDHVHFVQMPPGTPAGFPVTQVLCELVTEIDAPDADGFAGNLDATLEQQLLDVSIIQRISVGNR